MTTTFEQLIDLFKKTAELRNVVNQIQTNPTQIETIKPALVPAVQVLEKQFEKVDSKENFKKNLLETVNNHFSKQIDNFFEDIEILKNFIK